MRKGTSCTWCFREGRRGSLWGSKRGLPGSVNKGRGNRLGAGGHGQEEGSWQILGWGGQREEQCSRVQGFSTPTLPQNLHFHHLPDFLWAHSLVWDNHQKRQCAQGHQGTWDLLLSHPVPSSSPAGTQHQQLQDLIQAFVHLIPREIKLRKVQ